MLGWVALILLTVIGYSAGAVFSSWTRPGVQKSDPSPSLVDTAVVVVLWIGAIASRVIVLGPWTAVGVWFAVGLVTAFVLNRVQPHLPEGKSLPQ